MKKRILNILFWSVVSAAFIGPGTVTTAAKAGNAYGFNLLWALLFSTFACLLLQEASARITIKTGRNIGETMKDSIGRNPGGRILLFITVLAIAGGAAAYQMGNLLGAREGLILITDQNPVLLTLLLGSGAALVLFIPSLKIVSRIMGIMVLILGVSFLYTAITLKPDFKEIISGAFIPVFPDNEQAHLLILGLIGTTIVPYNIFLGSGLGQQNNNLREMRFGLIIAVMLGGIFSMAVVIVGTAVSGEFSFESLAAALGHTEGKAGKILLGTGLFAAGFTSSITAPLASAITIRSLFGNQSSSWKENGIFYRLSWAIVLIIGLLFALSGFKPIPAIISAQALNGFILPFVSFFLVWALNKRKEVNPLINNLLLGITLIVCMVIGLKNLLNVILPGTQFAADPILGYGIILISVIFTGIFLIVINRR